MRQYYSYMSSVFTQKEKEDLLYTTIDEEQWREGLKQYKHLERKYRIVRKFQYGSLIMILCLFFLGIYVYIREDIHSEQFARSITYILVGSFIVAIINILLLYYEYFHLRVIVRVDAEKQINYRKDRLYYFDNIEIVDPYYPIEIKQSIYVMKYEPRTKIMFCILENKKRYYKMIVKEFRFSQLLSDRLMFDWENDEEV